MAVMTALPTQLALAAPASLPPALAMLRRRYLLAMASLVLVDFGITGIFILVAGRTEVALLAAVCNLSFLGVANLIGAWWLFRPLKQLAANPASPAGVARLQQMAGWSGRWIFAISMVYCIAAFYLGVISPPGSDMEAVDLRIRIVAIVWYPFVFAANYAFYAYFLVDDLIARFRAGEAVTMGVTVPPLDSRLGVKLGSIFFVIAFLPASLIGLDLSIFEELRRVQGLSATQTIVLDIVASFFAISVSLLFATRSILRPVALLEAAHQQVGTGNLETVVPVVSNDEIGRLTSSFNDMVAGLKERELIRDTFGRYLNPEVVGQLISGGGKLESRMLDATVMFTDIKGFTTLSERLSPEETVVLLNEYFAVVNEQIHKHGGYVNNFIGDAVVAVFNVPAPQADHAAAAVRAARDIQAALTGRRFADGILLPTRVGINTGTVCAGVIGSQDRMGYTVYGDAVNVAARVEPLNKEFETSILITESTEQLAREAGPFRPLGKIKLRGRAEEVGLFCADVESGTEDS
jgi:class 3 adenylate cyclase